jgi:hypothetical protein
MYIFIFINIFMDYLTNYYKNLAEQLQQEVIKLENLINEAEIYSPQQMSARGRSPQASAKRAALLQKLKGIKAPNDSIKRVIADIEDPGMPSPGSPNIEAARRSARAAQSRFKGVYGTEFPEEGMAGPEDMRSALLAARGDLMPTDVNMDGIANLDDVKQRADQLSGKAMNNLRPYGEPSEMAAGFMAGSGPNKNTTPPGFAKRIRLR